MLAGPAGVAVKDDRAGNRLAPLPAGTKAADVGYAFIDSLLPKHLLDLDACTKCGKCHAACPATATGYPLSPRDLVLDLREVGLTDLSCDQLIGLYGHGITANYIREMHALGLTDATPGQLVTMFDHGVDAAFVREMRGLGYTDLTASQWVDLRDNDGEDEDQDDDDDDDTDDQG